MRRQVHVDVVENQMSLIRNRIGTAQQRPHARQQRVDVERLGDVIVGAGVQSAHRVLILGARGDHDHRQIARRGLSCGFAGTPRCPTSPAASSPAARYPAAAPAMRVRASCPSRCLGHAITLLFQIVAQHRRERGFVLDHKNQRPRQTGETIRHRRILPLYSFGRTTA